jgi:RND family efflux transporter MFP subunit
MFILNRLYRWYGRRNVLISLAVIVGLILVGLFLHFSSNKIVETPVEERLSTVTLSRVADLGSQSTFRVTGTVKAVSEARLQTEASGRITSVNVALGDSVRQGTIIASLENSRESAAVLQAQGAYEAAVAGAASSESGTDSAEIALESALSAGVSAYKSAFISADSAVRNTIDDSFNNPTGATPGFRLNAFGAAPSLNTERTALEPVLDSWASEVNTVSNSDIKSKLAKAQNDVERISAFAETIAALISKQDTSNSGFSQTDKDTLEAEFVGIRTSLNATQQALEGARTAIENAEEALTQAQIAGSGTTVSLSDAQLKSALGTLRAAQANYEKTIVRTPISGVVNALYLKAGDYANPGAPAAVVANNNALEISTALSSDDADMIEIGEEVYIDETVTGIVTAIAPAIDPISGKKEVKISVSDDTELTNGSIVSVEFKRNATSSAEAKQEIIVPLSSLKITASGPIAFTVSQDSTLVAHPVVLGEILGDMVVVTEGLSSDTSIVVDARGLKEGEKVEVTQ